MNWNDRLTKARIAKNIKKIDFAKMLGVSPSAVTQWENGTTSKLEGENLIAACAALDIAPSWLLHGTGEMNPSNSLNLENIPGAMPVVISDDSSEFYQIAKVQLKLQAGITGFQTEPDRRDGGTRGVPRSWADRKGFDPARLIALEIKGESMEPKLFAGDLVIVNTADTVRKDGEVYAFNYDGEAVIKRLVRERGEWWLFSDSTDQVKFRPKSCRENECIIIGRIVKKESEHI